MVLSAPLTELTDPLKDPHTELNDLLVLGQKASQHVSLGKVVHKSKRYSLIHISCLAPQSSSFVLSFHASLLYYVKSPFTDQHLLLSLSKDIVFIL